MYVVMCPQDFEFEGQNCALPIKIQTKMRYYLPVYERIEDATNDFPNHRILEAHFAKKE